VLLSFGLIVAREGLTLAVAAIIITNIVGGLFSAVTTSSKRKNHSLLIK
jgi:hypothetical protein